MQLATNKPIIKRSLVNEAEQIQLAIDMINLGARLQLLEAQTTLSRERLISLYKELRGISPPKGMLPFSTDWFLTWQPNVHSSIFYNIYTFMVNYAEIDGIQALIKAYKLYLLQVDQDNVDEAVLSMTRAWTLVRFVESKMLKMHACTSCRGHFIVDAFDLNHSYVCNLCCVPSRAGKTKKLKESRYKIMSATA